MSLPNIAPKFSSKWLIALFWLLLMASLTLFFNGFINRRDNPNHNLAVNEQLAAPVVLERNRAGHYVAPGAINGHPVTFLIDTGATDISVPLSVAGEIGLKKGRPIPVSTANGNIDVYQTNLNQVQLGGIQLHNVRATINPYMSSNTVLLGMSFMKKLDMTQRQGTLVLQLPQ